MTERASSPPAGDQLAVDGDAGSYLEELIEGEPQLAPVPPPAALVPIELAGPHLRLAGGIDLGRFRRLSDVLNPRGAAPRP